MKRIKYEIPEVLKEGNTFTTQKKYAEYLGISAPTYAQIVNRRRVPSPDMVRKLLSNLGFPEQDIQEHEYQTEVALEQIRRAKLIGRDLDLYFTEEPIYLNHAKSYQQAGLRVPKFIEELDRAQGLKTERKFLQEINVAYHQIKKWRIGHYVPSPDKIKDIGKRLKWSEDKIKILIADAKETKQDYANKRNTKKDTVKESLDTTYPLKVVPANIEDYEGPKPIEVPVKLRSKRYLALQAIEIGKYYGLTFIETANDLEMGEATLRRTSKGTVRPLYSTLTRLEDFIMEYNDLVAVERQFDLYRLVPERQIEDPITDWHYDIIRAIEDYHGSLSECPDGDALLNMLQNSWVQYE